jgi:hypothetical protein
MGSNASFSASVVLKGRREGAHPAKSIYQPFVDTVGRFPPVSPWRSHVASPAFFFLFLSLFLGAKICLTRACEFNSLSKYTPEVYRVSNQSQRLSGVCFERRTRKQDFDDRRAYSFDRRVYNYVWVRSRAIILFLSIRVRLFRKSSCRAIHLINREKNLSRNINKYLKQPFQ